MKKLIERLEESKMKPKEKIAAIQKILDDESMGKVDGVMVDIVTANMLIKIYNALSKKEMKDKFSSLPIKQMVDVGWQLVKK